MKIKVSNTNYGSGNKQDCVRVYVDGERVAEVFPPRRNPLQYIRDHDGKYRSDLLEQCVAAGIPLKRAMAELGIEV